jgi:tRNA-dihydrouridine synthase C
MLALAPMEGLVDENMRTLLTRDGAFDHCVTEFLRISDQLLPAKVFHRICPESLNGWKTPSGTPVHLQLLGSDPELMADNAFRGTLLGAPTIDVNFGCPSKTVNRNRGGSILLKDPEDIYQILLAMRTAMPDNVPLTAKMRLGYEDKSLAVENAQAVEAAGASQLCIHARTKIEGYKPPAHWHYIAKIKEQVSLPIIANGEIWNLEDYKLAKQESNCDDIMLGRGAVAMPDLARQVNYYENGQNHKEENWNHRLTDMLWMIEQVKLTHNEKATLGKIKQWLSFLKFRYDEVPEFFKRVRSIKTIPALIEAIQFEFTN